MTLEQLVQEVRTLSIEERKRLIGMIVDTLTEPESAPVRQKRSILEFEGVGAEIWDGVDAQEYVDQLRSEFGERIA